MGLLPDQHQAIIKTNAGILLIGPLGTNFSETLIKILAFSFKKMHLKASFGKWQSFCLGLSELKHHDAHVTSLQCQVYDWVIGKQTITWTNDDQDL